MKRLRKFRDESSLNINDNKVTDELENIHDDEIADNSSISNDATYERKLSDYLKKLRDMKKDIIRYLWKFLAEI